VAYNSRNDVYFRPWVRICRLIRTLLYYSTNRIQNRQIAQVDVWVDLYNGTKDIIKVAAGDRVIYPNAILAG
jgi:hypothetical protein